MGQPPRGSHPGQRWAPYRTGEGCVFPEPGPPRASWSLCGLGMRPAASQKPQGSYPAEAGCQSCNCFLSLASMKVMLCQEPPREIPPMTNVMQKEHDRQRRIGPRGIPWICLSIYPKTRICLSYYFVPFTNSSDINRGLSPTNFFWKKST